jgi:hypothetical protein
LLTDIKTWLSGRLILEKATEWPSTEISGFWLSDVEYGCLGKPGTIANTNGFFYTQYPIV